MIESSTLPDNIWKEYEEAQKKRFQISHYVHDEKKPRVKLKVEKNVILRLQKSCLKKARTFLGLYVKV